MCDYSLTDNPAESDVPTEGEPWQPVDVSDVEAKFSQMSTTPVEAKAEAPASPPAPQEEVDFGSEPEEVALKTPLVSTASALPTSTSSGQDSTMADVTLPADSTTAPTVSATEVNPKPKGAPEVKSPPASKPAAKAPPAGAQAHWDEYRKVMPFLRIAPEGDSDAPATTAKAGFTPPPRSASLPKSSLKPRSKSRAASRPPSKEPERSHTPKRGSMSPPRQEEQQEQPKRKKTVGAISSSYFTGYTHSDINPVPRYTFDEMPRDLYSRFWKKDFLAWTLRDLKRSWGADSRAFVNLHVGLYMYDATAKYPVAQPPGVCCLLTCGRLQPQREIFVVGVAASKCVRERSKHCGRICLPLLSIGT